jgi:hypothetical protein
MIVHSMTPARMLAEARKDLPALRNKLVAPVSRLRKEHTFDPKGELIHMYPWTSPARNNWLVVLKCTKRGVTTHTLAWYEAKDGRIAAIWLTGRGMAYHIDAAVIEQFAAYADESESPLERLQSFFFENHAYVMQVEEPQGEHHWNVSIGAGQGMGLGQWDTTTDIVHWRSFIHLGQLFPEQNGQHETMGQERRWFDMSPVQRMELYDRARGLVKRQQGRAA